MLKRGSLGIQGCRQKLFSQKEKVEKHVSI
jgi:hypothetical protein